LAEGGGFRLLWAATLLVPLLVFGAAAFWSWQSVDLEVRKRLERTVDMLHEHALRSFETQEAILEAVDQRIGYLDPEALLDSREVHEFLAGVIRRAQPSGGIVVAGPDNRILSASFAFPVPGRIDLSDRDYVRALRGGYQGTYIGEVILTRPQNMAVFTISRRSSNGDMLIVSSFKPDYFEDFYSSVSETDEDVVALVRADGAILARAPNPGDVASYRERSRDPVFTDLVQSDRVTVFASPVDGKTRFYGLRKVGSYPVLVSYGLSESVRQSAWLRQLAVSGTVCLAAALLLMIFTLLAQRSVRREQAALAAARLEAERRADAEARLRHAQRVEALGQIVGGVAHDFRNVVMRVEAGARAIVRRAHDPSEIRRVAGLIEATAERGLRLTERMLGFARRDEIRSEVVDVVEALQAVADLLGQTLGSGYRVVFETSDPLPPGRGDRAELETVVVNLVVNARDAMPEGGTVSIAATEETIPADGSGHASGLAPGRYVRISVSDHGTGIEPAILARVGEAFFTTKEPGKGTGLGLAMARGFAASVGGTLRIHSEPGRGTTVLVWIAAAD